mgnify:CR=1 FL=1
MGGLSLYEMGLFYCRWRRGKTYIQKLVAMAEESGMSFASFLMDVRREHMLKMVQELQVISSVLMCVCCERQRRRDC